MSSFLAFDNGNGRGFSVREIVEVAGRVTGRTIPTRVAPGRDGDSAVLIADFPQASRELGWAPQYTSVEDQVGHAWNWYRQQSSPAGRPRLTSVQ